MKTFSLILIFLILCFKINAQGVSSNGLDKYNRFKTLELLYEISGRKTISGIHNREPNRTPAVWTDEIFKTTGKYPSLWSGDFLFQEDNIADRQAMINEAAAQWKKGAVINIMWHACNPALEQPCGWNKQGVLSKLTDDQWKELVTDGSAINTRWKLMMDEVAVYLQQLKDKGVEVMFRPLHEMNQGVFWWGGRPGDNGTRKLYQITHDYLTKTKGLTNLIWIWDMQDFGTLANDVLVYNPGNRYWDIAALDIYDDKSGFSKEKYDIMVAAAQGKPIAIGECQKYPTVEILEKQPKWTFFMGWSELVFKFNTNQEINKLINASNVISLDELEGWQTQQNNIKTFKQLNATVKQYEKAEWSIVLNAGFGNPYLQEEISLDMLLTAPSGKHIVLPCFYESGESGAQSAWKARFMPEEKGKYDYRFQLNKAGALVSSSKTGTFMAGKSSGKGILHANNDWTFKFDNGTIFRGIGENLAWESRANDDSKFFKELHEKEKYNYEYMLPSLVKHGGNYFRTWISSWNLPLDWKSGFNSRRYINSDEYFNPSAIQKMDRLVDLSDSLGICMMLTLGEGTHDTKNGRYAISTPDFFVNEQAKAQYRNRLRFIVARWGYSPSIGAWEFFNEIDNVQFRNADNPIDPDRIVKWHDEMSTYLKRIDPYKHLVTTSISHRDLKGLNSLKNIDFNQKHIYKNNRALPVTIEKYLQDFKKPYVIGEYGYEYDWSKNFNLFADEMDSDFKRGLWYGLFSPTPVLPMSWWWEFFDDRGTDAYISRVKVISDQMLGAGKGSFEKMNAVSSLPEIEIYSVKCGTKVFVYVYNPGRETKQPVIELADLKEKPKQLKIYDCESGRFRDLKGAVSNGKLLINDFELAPNADAVFIF